MCQWRRSNNAPLRPIPLKTHCKRAPIPRFSARSMLLSSQIGKGLPGQPPFYTFIVLKVYGSGANAAASGDDGRMPRFVSVEELFKGRHFARMKGQRMIPTKIPRKTPRTPAPPPTGPSREDQEETVSDEQAWRTHGNDAGDLGKGPGCITGTPLQSTEQDPSNLAQFRIRTRAGERMLRTKGPRRARKEPPKKTRS